MINGVRPTLHVFGERRVLNIYPPWSMSLRVVSTPARSLWRGELCVGATTRVGSLVQARSDLFALAEPTTLGCLLPWVGWVSRLV